MVKHRNPITIVVFSFLTGGIYFVYWLISTTKELQNLTSSTPNPLLALSAFVPFANPFLFVWFMVKYCRAAEETIYENKGSLFIQFLVVAPAAIVNVQNELNKMALAGK